MAIVTGVQEFRGVVTVSADGRELAHIKKEFFVKSPLSEGDAIDADEYLDRMAAMQFAPAYEAALTLLDYCARTAAELKRALRRKGYVDAAIDAAVERLREARLIDDLDYARRKVQAQKSAGVYAIRRKLMAKGVAQEDLEAALADVDEADQRAAARALAERMARKYEGLEPRAAKAKLGQALARRGFAWEVISGALDGLFDEEW